MGDVDVRRPDGRAQFYVLFRVSGEVWHQSTSHSSTSKIGAAKFVFAPIPCVAVRMRSPSTRSTPSFGKRPPSNNESVSTAAAANPRYAELSGSVAPRGKIHVRAVYADWAFACPV